MAMLLKAGFGKINITPKADGTFRIFDPIYIRALHLQQGEQRVTFLAADLFAIDDGFLAMVMDELGDAHSDSHWILPAASHLGTGPALFQFYVAQPTAALRHFDQDLRYAKAAADAIRQAVTDASPAQIDAGATQAPIDLSYNRRAHDSDGNLTIVSLSEYPQPPQELNYGQTDRQFGLVALRRAERRPIVLINYGCHALTLWAHRGNISGDYPGRLCQMLDQQDVDAIFIQGALGNTHPWRKDDDPCLRIAKVLCNLTQMLLKSFTYDGSQTLHLSESSIWISTDDRLPSKTEAQATWEKACKHMETQEGLDRYWYWLSQRYEQDKGYRVPIRAITVGTTALVHVPGEPFVETANMIRESAPFAHVLILSNPCPEVGYLPTRRAHEEGSGEVLFAPLQRDAEATIRDTILDVLNQSRRNQHQELTC